jgi:hypothetical protein
VIRATRCGDESQAGWASHDAPTCYFPTLVGQLMDGDGPPLVAERLRSAMGAPLLLRRPVRDAVVASFDDYQALLCDVLPTPMDPSYSHTRRALAYAEPSHAWAYHVWRGLALRCGSAAVLPDTSRCRGRRRLTRAVSPAVRRYEARGFQRTCACVGH